MNYIVADLRTGGSEAICTAIMQAVQADIRTVVIPRGYWYLEKPVALPDCVTVILLGAELHAVGKAFINANADLPYALATEQKEIHLLGLEGARVESETDVQIAFSNIQYFSISGIAFQKGNGLLLRHARKGKVSRLKFADCLHGIRMEEGCRELIVEDIHARTREESLCWVGGETTVWGRSNEMCQSMVSRVFTQTQGAPAVAVRQGNVPTDNIVIRDINDATTGTGYSIVLGEGQAMVRDITVRNLQSSRMGRIDKSCDGVYFTGNAETDPEATRILTVKGDTPRSPQLAPVSCAKWLFANDPAYRGETDAKTLQNAVCAAVKENAALIIPRMNSRSDKCLWEIDETIHLPSNAVVILLDAHLRMADYTYCNMFAMEQARNVAILGVGSATIDSGIPNGLKLKNAGKYGFGPITDNAMIRISHSENVNISDIHICQSRWYGIYCADSCMVNIRDIDYYAPPIFPDLGGIYVAGGCDHVTIENITGITGADAVLLEATGSAGNIKQVTASAMLANVSRCCMVRVFCHDGNQIHGVTVEGVIDSSIPEQKKQPRAMVCIGQPEGWQKTPVKTGELDAVVVRDICGRGAATVELGGKSAAVRIENVHSFNNTVCGLLSSPEPETTEFILKDTQEKLSDAFRKELTELTDCRVDGMFFRCNQASPYMRGTATSIITDKKKFVGTVANLTGIRAEKLVISNVFAEQVGEGIVVTGQAKVDVGGLQIAVCGREVAKCGTDCVLTINNQACEITESVVL